VWGGGVDPNGQKRVEAEKRSGRERGGASHRGSESDGSVVAWGNNESGESPCPPWQKKRRYRRLPPDLVTPSRCETTASSRGRQRIYGLTDVPC
jgi:hypothetical protein